MSGHTSAAVLLLGPSNGTSTDQTLAGTVEYLITDATGTTVGAVPLSGVSVSIVQDGQVLATPTSDANGNFSATLTLPSPADPVSAYAAVGTGYVSSASLVLQPPSQTISAADAASSLTDKVNADFPNSPSALSVSPFRQVSIADPTPGALLSASVSVSGPVAANLILPPLQNLSAAALASALDAAVLHFTGDYGGTDTVTADITDSTGGSGQLTSTDKLVYYTADGSPETTMPLVAMTSAPETGATATQTITGSATDVVFADLGQQVSSGPSAGAAVTISDNGTVLGQAVTDADGDFSADVTLPFTGSNNLSATMSDAFGTGLSAPVLDTLRPQTVGSGPDTLALLVSERGEPGGAQFVIDVNGQQVGGVQTTAADVTAGQTQQFDVQGSFAAGTNSVSVTYLNADNSLLFVDGAALDGAAVPGANLVLSNDGSESFNAAPRQSLTTVGSGPDTLALDLSQRGEPAGAQFTVAVDGVSIGGTQTVTADATAGRSQQLDVLGNFAPAVSHTVTVTYGNANNSLLLVDAATINGRTIAGGSEVLSNNGSLGFSFAVPAVPVALPLGAGPDILALSASELAAGGQFTVSVDGAPLGGVQTLGDPPGSGPQPFDVLGTFAGSHTVSIASVGGAALSFGAATLDGAAVANSAFTLPAGAADSFSITH